MDEKIRGLEQFLSGWVGEFGRAVEMFIGHTPTLTWDAAGDSLSQDKSDSSRQWLWYEQTYEIEGQRRSVWLGTPSETWKYVTENQGATPGECQQVYVELLGHSFQGAAHVVSSSQGLKFVCGTGAERQLPDSVELCTGILRMTLRDSQLPEILVGLEPSLAQLLGITHSTETSPRNDDPGTAGANESSSTGFERFNGINLPVSIVLGRRRVKIREMLRLSSGSLIELDQKVNDPIEIVVHGVVVALGEAVSVGGNYGVRILKVLERNNSTDSQLFQKKKGRLYSSA
jgi:flagellar motor switch protein FliN